MNVVSGVKKIGEADNEGAEPEYKFEWQRTWGHAPKESYLEKGDDYVEQPFGIQVGSSFKIGLWIRIGLQSRSNILAQSGSGCRSGSKLNLD
jgi:hypothetical protein